MKKLILAALMCGSITTGVASAGEKLSAELSNVAPNATVNVIVQWHHKPEAADHAKVTTKGGKQNQTYSTLNSAAYAVPAHALDSIANDPDVDFVAPDRPLRGLLDYSVAAINASAALTKGFNGAGIGVAVIDSGMVANGDLDAHHIVYSQDFTGEYKQGGNLADANANAPDTFGHGQHVAGILASTGKSSTCGNCTRVLSGISPGVSLINLRVLDEYGNGTDSAVIAAIDKAIALKNTYNIRVINLSLGRPVYESYTLDPLCQAVEQAWKAGIVVVVAAGNNGRDNSNANNGYGTITAPGNDPYVITVGAMKSMQTYARTDDLIASYSSKGPTAIDYVVKPDIVAPGNQVVSLLASNKATLPAQYKFNITARSYYTSNNDKSPSNAYFSLSGTSMATPVVSAAVADLLQAQPGLNPDQIKARLMLSASKTFPTYSTAVDPVTGQAFTSYYDLFTVGAGYLDLAAALSSNSIASASALSPTAVFDSATGSIYLVGDTSAIWTPAGSGAFSVSTVWGTAFIDATSTSWGQRVGATSTSWGQRLSATSTSWGQRVSVSSSTLSALSNGVSPANPSIAATSAPTAESAPVAITGEQ